jgi:hypothetical protein
MAIDKNHLKTARFLAKLLDSQYQFLGVRFGIESIVGVIPGIGDLCGLFLSLYLVWIGYAMELPFTALAQMIVNVLIDFIIGSIPVIGDIGDVFFKANIKNLHIIETYAAEEVLEGEIIEE